MHTVTASGIVQDYIRREIAPNYTHQVNQGVLQIWVWNNMYIGRLMTSGNVEMTSHYAYYNTASPQAIADNIYSGAGGDSTISQLSPSKAAAALGSIKSEKKAKSSAKNGKLGGRPKSKDKDAA